MSELLDRSDVSHAYNRISTPSGHRVQEAPKVQWAYRKAIDALDRLALEVNIAEARDRAQRESASAARQRKLAADLRKYRTR